MDKPADDVSSFLEIEMDSPQAIRRKVKSKTQKKNYQPYWDKVGEKDEGILFRGTYHELKAQELILTLIEPGLIGGGTEIG